MMLFRKKLWLDVLICRVKFSRLTRYPYQACLQNMRKVFTRVRNEQTQRYKLTKLATTLSRHVEIGTHIIFILKKDHDVNGSVRCCKCVI